MGIQRKRTTKWFKGDRKVPAGTRGATKRQIISEYWSGSVVIGGRRITRKLSRDRKIAEKMYAKLLSDAEMQSVGYPAARESRLLSDLLQDYRAHLKSKGDSPEHVRKQLQRITDTLQGCGWSTPEQASASGLTRWLAEVPGSRKGKCQKRGLASANYYLGATKSFFRWLARSRLIDVDPLAHLERARIAKDSRRQRRALSIEEIRKLLEVTAASPKQIQHRDGTTRAFLYALAVCTGLRRKELASLTPPCFALDGPVPTVTASGAYTKNKNRAVQELPPDLVRPLADWLQGKPPTVPVFGWVCRPFEMLKKDLLTAGIPYQTRDGIADFHALRHTFISLLAKAGVHPKIAQGLARHSTITLTLDLYTHSEAGQRSEAINRLPPLLAAHQPLTSRSPSERK